ncbi:MAG TPA: type IV pilus assembly protein PilM [Verrucomicrobiae bacterium]|nr:type IV pilus assembly protein PilM [Verrucomicrobiae bacterium]
MLNAKSFLTVDFGAGTLKVAEFEVNEVGGLRLKEYALKPLGAEGAKEETREAVLQKALQQLLAEKSFRAKDVNVCAPGFHVFSKFVKLPPISDSSKITQIIQYEAQQNVPFPLTEVVWDYQIMGTTATGELEVLLVAIKSDIVEGLFRVAEAAGLRLQLADVSSAALCNAFRYNYGDLEDCTMLLDIGAKTSNLLFFEKGKVYSRSINLGANSITTDFEKESKLPFAEAEAKKISEGFVSLGGAYEEPENPHQAAISKIARQFMTRLHIQVNQTMQFYRGQQGGSAPQRLFLCGGASLMPYTAQFFAEKLNVPVEYFNPFRNVQIDPAINLEDLARVAHSLGEVVGLGLRNLAHCPVELNLMPESTLNWVQFNQKKPYFIATVFSLALVIFLTSWVFNKLGSIYQEALDHLNEKITPLQQKEVAFKSADADRKKAKAIADQYAAWIDERYYWPEVLTELHQLMIQVEADTKGKLHTDTGVWIEKFITANNEEGAASGAGGPGGSTGTYNYNPRVPPGINMDDPRNRMFMSRRPPGVTPGAPAAATATAKGASNEVSEITVVFRGVNLNNISPTADNDIYYATEAALKGSPLFDPVGTHLDGQNDITADAPTFTFGMVIKLKKPIKL